MNHEFLKKFFFRKKNIYILCIVILLLGVISTTFHYRKEIQEKITEFFVKKMNSHLGQRIRVKNVAINLFKKEFHLHDVSIMDHHNFYLIHLPQCKISVKNFFQYFFISSKYLNIGNLILENPNIFVKKYLNEKENNFLTIFKEFILKRDLNKTQTISCSNFRIKNAHLVYEDFNSKESYKNNFSTSIRNIKIDENKKIEATIFFLKSNGYIKRKNYRIENFFCHLTYFTSKLKIHNFFLRTSNSHLKGKVIFFYDATKNFGKNNMSIKGEIFEGSKFGSDLINIFFSNLFNKESFPLMFSVQGFINGRFNEKISFSKICIKNIPFNKIFAEKINIFYNLKKEWKEVQFLKTIFQTSVHEIKKIFPSYYHSKLNLLNSFNHILSYRGDLIFKKKWMKINGNIQYKTFKTHIYTCISRANNNRDIQYIGKFSTTRKDSISSIDSLIPLKIPFFSLPSGLWICNFKGIYKNFSFKKNIQNSLNHFFITLFFPSSGIEINCNGKIHNNFQKFFLSIYTKNENKFFKKMKILLIKNKSKKNFFIDISDMITGYIHGDFIWKDFLESIKKEIFSLKKNLHLKNNSIRKKQYAFFYFSIKKGFWRFMNFQKKIKILSDIQLSGISKNNGVEMSFFTKKIQLKEILIDHFHLKVNSFIKNKIQLYINQISFNNFLSQKIDLSIFDKKNFFLINFNFFCKFKKKEFQKQTLNFLLKKINYNNNFLIFFILPSKLNINGYNWFIVNHMDRNIGKIKIDLVNKKYIIDNMILSSINDNERIFIKFYFHQINNMKFQILLENMQLKKILPKKDLMINGYANGIFIFKMGPNKIEPNNININIKNISIGKKVIGNFYIHSNNSKIHGILKNKDSSEIFSLSGNINNELQKKYKLNWNVSIKNFSISDFPFFWKEMDSEARGFISGKIRIFGNLYDPHYFGKLELKKFGIKINSINTDYEMTSPAYINLVYKSCILNTFSFRDIKYNTEGYINGVFLHKNFLKWNGYLSINSQKLLVLDTNKKPNTFFFGKIFSKGKIQIIKKKNYVNICMEKGNILSSSHLYINPNGSSKYQKKDFIELMDPNIHQIQKHNNHKKNENKNKEDFLSLNIKTDIDEKTKVSILLDDNLENFLELRGKGFLFLEKKPKKEVQISGKYFVTDGLYHFSNQEIIPIIKLEKRFRIKPGGLITWTNNFSHSNINVIAYYTKYVSNIIEYIDLSKYYPNHENIILTELRMNLHGQIQKPNISLDILFPNSNEEIQKKLSNKLNSNEEKTIQFLSILTIGRFFLKNSIKKDFFHSYAYNIILKQLGNFLSEINQSFNINFDFFNDNKNRSNSFLSSIYYEINDRFSIKSNLGFIFKKMKQEKIGIRGIGDIQLDLDIHRAKNSNLKLLLFSRPENFILSKKSAISQIYGSGIIYTISSEDLLKIIRGIFSYIENFFHKKYLEKEGNTS
ncbi:translocation/assembly module TamB domain-containing protein [Blattabacterium cuenoti]|uniref:translocation/assembly module TamB domain-containing protein n=1 Tax=Blattabacterium cuenoti TaxID=1653831 RepID=UPI001EEB4D1D|nr:translocation/assembly module TamB domain-containing protein [Blattabacterium cuenoti]